MTPRPRKPRTCACPHRPPGSQIFKPAGIPLKDLERVELHQDELEALRLCDQEGLTQAEAGARMDVSRGTVQRLVTSGRHKLVTALVDCRALLINPPAEPEQRLVEK
jgi:predicted DNA-binding protein (UPF0251 family)